MISGISRMSQQDSFWANRLFLFLVNEEKEERRFGGELVKPSKACRDSVSTTLAAVAPGPAWVASCWSDCLWTTARRARFLSQFLDLMDIWGKPCYVRLADVILEPCVDLLMSYVRLFLFGALQANPRRPCKIDLGSQKTMRLCLKPTFRKLQSHYPKHFKAERAKVWCCPQVATAVVEPYNTVLYFGCCNIWGQANKTPEGSNKTTRCLQNIMFMTCCICVFLFHYIP